MPNNILITPGSANIQFSGSAANTIRLQVEDSGSIAFYGNGGSLFGITDSLSGSLMSVNDISGLPILEVFSDDRVVMGTFNRNTLVVTGSRVGVGKNTPLAALDVSGSVLITGSLTMNSGGITGSLLGTATTSSYTPISSSIIYVVDGGGSVITTGVKGDLVIPFACTIQEWTLLADAVGSVVVDIWKDSYANYPPTSADAITGSAAVSLSSADKNQSSTLTGWTTAIAPNDVLRFNVSSVATITRLTITLDVTR
jgi:hypothetical protein